MSVIRHPRASTVGRLPRVAQTPMVTDSLELLFSSEPDRQQAVTRVYLALVQNPGSTRQWLVARGEHPRAVEYALETLQLRGLVVVHGDGTVEVRPPDVALPQAAIQLERQGASLRALAREVTALYLTARRNDTQANPPVTYLLSLDDISRATFGLEQSGARALTLRAASARTHTMLSLPPRPVTGPPGADRHRVVYDPQVLDHPGALEAIDARSALGEDSRFFDGLPFSLTIAEGVGAVIDASTDEHGFDVGVHVSAGAVVASLWRLAERLWELAERLAVPGQEDLVDDRDRSILLLLAAGATDVAIARSLDVSQRTVERRIRAILDRLGVTTRFQAGVQAVRRGWV